jgi:hypothetical protein
MVSVYVDELRGYATEDIKQPARRYGRQWCHLTADTEDELHAFAARLGLRRAWFQPSKRKGGAFHWYLSHYDLVSSKRALAVRLGAVEVQLRERAERFAAELWAVPS